MHEDYKETLFNNKQMYHKMKTIRSQNHELGSYEINKVSLSCFDDKRYIHKNGITSYAYGHYKRTHRKKISKTIVQRFDTSRKYGNKVRKKNKHNIRCDENV